MSRTGFYLANYRCWYEQGEIWLERLDTHETFSIEGGYTLQVVEMLVRLMNSRHITPEAQVRSTEEGERHGG